MVWILLAVVIILLGILVAPILVDALTLSGTLKAATEVDTRIGKRHDTLFVHFPGMLFPGTSGCEPFQNTLSEYGDTARIAYHGERFNSDAFVQYAAKKIGPDLSEYDRIVLLGTSMGGKLALDFSKLIEHPKVSLVMIDTPVSSSQLLAGGNIFAPLMRFLPFGRVSNVAYRPLMRLMLAPPKLENIELQLDADEVIARAKVSLRQWSVSIWRDQLDYLARRKVVPEDLERFDRVLYVRCSGDNETVAQPDAAYALADLADRPVSIVDMQTTHCGYAESPIETSRTFKEIAERVCVVV